MIRAISADEMQRAHDEWGANCGPSAVAAIMGMTLNEVRPHMGDFERKRYTNPTLMWRVLDSIGRPWRLVKPPCNWPDFGLARIQWEGPWTEPGAPIRARYRHTHWVAAMWSENRQEYGIFDCNATGNGAGWCSVGGWAGEIVPWIIENAVPRANGRWHLTHVVEIEKDNADAASRP